MSSAKKEKLGVIAGTLIGAVIMGLVLVGSVLLFAPLGS
jgi:hypothetical protein